MTPFLKVDRVTKSFGGLAAVSDVSMEIARGELVGLIGPNGAGKTTVFNLLTGVYTPTKGTISFEGRTINGLRPHQLAAVGIARTFQNIRLFRSLTVLQNVLVAAHLRSRRSLASAILRPPGQLAEDMELRFQAMQLLDRLELKEYAHQPSASLAYGMQRRLEIARALATRPKLLLLDEPAAGMNPNEKLELMELIRRIRHDFKLTILLIEHDMRLVMGVCERLYVLDYGEIIAKGSPEDVRTNPAVIAAYLGTETV